MGNIIKITVFSILVSVLMFNGSVLFAQNTPNAVQGYSLEIQKVFPTKNKVEVLMTNAKILSDLDKTISSQYSKYTSDNCIMTIKGPGNYSNTKIIQNIKFIIVLNDSTIYCKNEETADKYRKESYPSKTSLLISECTVYGTINAKGIKATDTLNYIYSFKYYENSDTIKISEKASPVFVSQYFPTKENCEKAAKIYKDKLNDNSKNRLLRFLESDNNQLVAFPNYENFMKNLETEKKAEAQKISEQNKRREEEQIKKEKAEAQQKVFDNIEKIEYKDFKKMFTQIQGIINNSDITTVAELKDVYRKSNEKTQKQLSEIIENLVKKSKGN